MKTNNEKSKNKLQKGFKLISSILLIGMPLVFLLDYYFSYLPDVRILPLFFAFSIHFWFIFFPKIFNSTLQILICALISLLLIVFGIIFAGTGAYFVTVLTIPMSSIIVMLLANKLIGMPSETNSLIKYYSLNWDRFLLFLFSLFSVLLSVLFYNLILKHLISYFS
jgi:hypothetical protein